MTAAPKAKRLPIESGATALTKAFDLLEMAGKRITKFARDGRKKVAKKSTVGGQRHSKAA